MVLVLADTISKRLEYTFYFIFHDHGIDYELTENIEEFEGFEGIKLNYSSNKTVAKKIDPSGLLSEVEIKEVLPEKGSFNHVECLIFNTIPDPVASIFYILTRYEEYRSIDLDEHGRYQLKNSSLSEFNWNRLAICDRWVENIFSFLDLSFKTDYKVEIVPTFDIDNTYAYKLKRGNLFWLALAKDITRLQFQRFRERFEVLRGGHDPYDTFEKISNTAMKFEQTKVFWLVSDRTEKDRNIPVSVTEHNDLIKRMSQITSVNLHPGYATNGRTEPIKKEKVRLEKVIENPIDSVRMHFLRIKLPDTYNSLVESGFTNEYSMGFAEDVGFRCGTARAHKWFDLKLNNETELTVHPFVYMDGTLNEYLGLSIEESKDLIGELYTEVKKYGGDFVFLWHNETIGNYGIWNGWEEVFEYTLNLKRHES